MSERHEQDLFLKISGHAHRFTGYIAPQLNAVSFAGDGQGGWVIFQCPPDQDVEIAKLVNFKGRRLTIIVIDEGHAGIVDKGGNEVESRDYSEELASLTARRSDWKF